MSDIFAPLEARIDPESAGRRLEMLKARVGALETQAALAKASGREWRYGSPEYAFLRLTEAQMRLAESQVAPRLVTAAVDTGGDFWRIDIRQAGPAADLSDAAKSALDRNLSELAELNRAASAEAPEPAPAPADHPAQDHPPQAEGRP